ncbi:MAG: sel1 repeat family protein [Ectothiorhodospiraceae bacterium]|nr:sel1 repeat family protein [Ectothiorhodospiraceae bacterium]
MRDSKRGHYWKGLFVLLAICLTGGVQADEADPLDRSLSAYYAGDFKAAYNFTIPLANQGNPDAKNLLGMMYELGRGVPQNLSKSISYYREAAEQGNPYAQYNLAVSFDAGTGVPQNYREAVRWFTKSAEQGISSAQYDLGVMLEQGRGTPKNFIKAADWYQKAANQGHMQAQNNLAWLYESGKGVTQNLIAAYALFDAAAAQGLETASVKRDTLKTSLSAKELRQAQGQSQKMLKAVNQSTPQYKR